jgi:hypothetical protein
MANAADAEFDTVGDLANAVQKLIEAQAAR